LRFCPRWPADVAVIAVLVGFTVTEEPFVTLLFPGMAPRSFFLLPVKTIAIN
jgi:hypothetical protein